MDEAISNKLNTLENTIEGLQKRNNGPERNY